MFRIDLGLLLWISVGKIKPIKIQTCYWTLLCTVHIAPLLSFGAFTLALLAAPRQAMPCCADLRFHYQFNPCWAAPKMTYPLKQVCVLSLNSCLSRPQRDVFLKSVCSPQSESLWFEVYLLSFIPVCTFRYLLGLRNIFLQHQHRNVPMWNSHTAGKPMSN